MTKSRGIIQNRVRWTPVMVQLLRDWYPIYASAVVAGALDVPLARVYAKANALGLSKSPEYLASDMAGRIQRGMQHQAMVAKRFQKGHTPWNKGKHVVAGGRSAETRFKPGQRPHTWVPVGTMRLVPGGSGSKQLVLQVKANDLPGPNHVRWHPVHRVVWIAANGPVPDDHIVVFKPGMRTNVLEEITVDRLECITRGASAERNHPRARSPELAKLVQLKGAITRQVNRIAREHEERSSS
ncbi:HNH endonuclease [Variovorax sp. EBFNA2]|uniref:HNH endonuclease n=1 Tax=Variovorax sp. EBFNA2 TaxID=3342097 RepID=UPI0029C00AD1|nr:HNH endonuclease [Variovorax boronicumulans]WPG35162.1 HNH endonuclease [Variovorax boronicumulans]